MSLHIEMMPKYKIFNLAGQKATILILPQNRVQFLASTELAFPHRYTAREECNSNNRALPCI